MKNDNTFWISAGELSGDMHGALLLTELRKRVPNAYFVGMGGLHLRQAGLETLFRTENLSTMGITEVLGRLPRIIHMISRIKASLARIRPKALVVIDAPDFHFRIIRAARELDIPVYYYISPKIWAWRAGRATFIRDNVRRLISILPFEQDFYARFGMKIDYVGNPLVDIVHPPSLEGIARQQGLVGFLPGSRNKEIRELLPAFGGAARILRQRLPHVVFACLVAPGIQEDFARSFWPEDVPIHFTAPGNRWAFMRQCEMLVAASGTAVLESALTDTPTLVTYKVSPVSFAIGKLLIKIPYISLPNLILGREIYPELLQNRCNAISLANAALAWLQPRPGTFPLREVHTGLAEVRRLLGEPGAAARAAGVILDDLRKPAFPDKMTYEPVKFTEKKQVMR